MDSWAMWFWIWLAMPLAAAAAAVCMRTPGAVLNVACAGLLAADAVGIGILAAWRGSPGLVVQTAGGWFRLDALSAYHAAILIMVHGFSSVFARAYFGVEVRAGHLGTRDARRFAALWAAAFVFMALVLLSNNLGVMWVSLEATTLVTAFLICVHRTRESLEAMWKYIVICSVGIAFAFLGEVMFASAARHAGVAEGQMLLLSHLTSVSPKLSPVLLKLGFLMLLVGYGTKAGLAPMHNWLPDAHSQAPAPVSALFSGFMLNTALYCILRHLPIVNGATGGADWAQGLLLALGLFSIAVAAAFILFQKDIKRFLAYSSVEHMGVIALGIGIGGLGTVAALFHAFNHSVGKTFAFFAAGRVGQVCGTHDMGRISGVLGATRTWGIGILVGVLALIGMAPFSVFMSELQILIASVSDGRYAVAALFLLGVGVVFVGALGHVIAVAWGEPPAGGRVRSSVPERGLVVAMAAVLLVLGLWMPDQMQVLLREAAAIIQNVPAAQALTMVQAG